MTNVSVTTHRCTYDYFIALIHIFPKGQYEGNKSKTCVWFTFEGFTFFLGEEYYKEYKEYIGDEEE